MKTTLTAKELSLYLGCECVITDVNPKWHGYINHMNRQVRLSPSILALVEDKINGETLAEVKPLLRKLESMTKEEEKEIFGVNMKYMRFEKSAPELYLFTAPEIQTLLSKHFDLFGYIDSGLAIDQASLTAKDDQESLKEKR